MPQELLFENARIIFRNFAGREGQYNREGDRNFCLTLSEEIASEMDREGWNVKALRAREEGDPDQPYIQVAVSFKGPRPPTLVLITSRGRTTIPPDLCEMIDYADIKNVDLIIRPYEWAVAGKTGTKAYLKSIYVTINEDALQLKYADVPEIGAETRELEAASPHKVWDFEGEIVEEQRAIGN